MPLRSVGTGLGMLIGSSRLWTVRRKEAGVFVFLALTILRVTLNLLSPYTDNIMANQKSKPTSARKKTASSRPKKTATAPTKRKRNSKPLYAEIKLGKLKELLGNDDSATVTVSRNFVLDKKKEQMEADAAKDLGIE